MIEHVHTVDHEHFQRPRTFSDIKKVRCYEMVFVITNLVNLRFTSISDSEEIEQTNIRKKTLERSTCLFSECRHQ